MRSVLALAVCLLGLTLALNLAGARAPLPRASGAGEDGGLDLLLASKPPLVPPGRIGAGEFFDLALVGDRVLVPDTGARGLQLVTLGPGLTFAGRRLLVAEEAPSFARQVAEARAGTVLIFSAVDLADRASTAPWRDTLRAIGARAPLAGEGPLAWVFLTARLRTGWVALAESYADDTGVALAFTLAPDLAVYRDHQAERQRLEPAPNAALHLERELAHAAVAERVLAAPTALVEGVPRAGLVLCPEAGAPARLRFPPLGLGEGAAFTAYLGYPDGALPSTDGVTCELHLDDTVVARRYLPPGTRGWVPWRVPLGDAAGTNPALALVTSAGVTSAGDTLVVAEPRLHRGQL